MLCTTTSSALHNQMHSKVTRHSYISQKSPKYPRYVLIDTSSDGNLQQNEDAIHIGLPKYQIDRLQSVLNTAARIITFTCKYDHITPVLVRLHWLPVFYRIRFKVLLLTYKALNDLSPEYIYI